MEWIQTAAGWETTACQKEVCVHLHVTLLNPPTVLLQKYFVTWDGVATVGMETIACQKDLYVLHLVTAQLPASVVLLT